MIPQRDDGLSLLTEENRRGNNNNNDTVETKKCRSEADNSHDFRWNHVPLEILVEHIAPFLDRTTYNSCLLLCRRARQTLKASWWKNLHRQLPPWPRKLVSRDASCRVRCLTFSEDNSLLACGCSDGKIRSWDVRLGEFPMTREGHWPDEAVVALAFSNSNEKRLLASSSTDGTIRIWKMNPPKKNTSCHSSAKRIQSDTTSTTRQMTCFDDEVDSVDESPSLVSQNCILSVPSDHVVSLHFSPDDSCLVSGHLAMRNAQDVGTIEIREVRSGLLLRRIEGGGVPVGFLKFSLLVQKGQDAFHESIWGDRDATEFSEEEHQLITTCGPNSCLKLWSWNRTQCFTNDETRNVNTIPGSLDHPRGIDHLPFHEMGDQSMTIAFPSHLNRDDRDDAIEQYNTALDNERCIREWSLDRFNTVLPLPTNACQINHSKNYCDDEVTNNGFCEILVAGINEASKNSFCVWNTKSPNDRQIFCNTSPYEIQFSPDGTKIASVDDFNTVKVWRISDGKILKTFSGHDESYYNDSIRFDDEDDSSVSYTDYDFGESEDGLFPIHELVFSKDSSTVAVISRFYNEVHLFST